MIAEKARQAAQNANINPATTSKQTAAAMKRREEIEAKWKQEEDKKKEAEERQKKANAIKDSIQALIAVDDNTAQKKKD